MAGLFFSRKSKNGTEPPPSVSPDADSLYDPLPAPALYDEPPEALPGVPDLYGVLGVDPRSSDDIIRYAYRKKASKLMDARWRPGRAARQLAELNAAYEILGKPDRRVDDDMLVQSGLPSPGRAGRMGKAVSRSKAPRGLLEAIAILGVVAIAIYAGYTVLGSWSQIDLGRLQDAGAAAGLPVRPRTAPAPTASPAPAVAAAPTPRQVVVPSVVVPTPSVPPATATTAAAKPSGSAQGSVRMSNQSPSRRTEADVIARITRDGKPLSNVPVSIVVHYKTVDERFPANDGNVPTNDNGEATITFNVGEATAGYLVVVDVLAQVEDQQLRMQTSFIPK
jgi:hypothetical protein